MMHDPGSIGRLMQGAIDFHVHADPDPYHPRRVDVLDLALQAEEAGMKAIVAKCHHFCTSPLAYVVNNGYLRFSHRVPHFLAS
jgi:hypothetical protein